MPPASGFVNPFAAAHASDPVVYVCYFDGEFVISMPPEALEKDGYPNRARVIVSSTGEAWLDVAAWNDTPGMIGLPIERPSAE